MKPLLLLALLVLTGFGEITSDQSSSKATQLIRVSYGLKDNYEFLRIINSTISNRGTELQKKYFKRCVQHHIESEILHLQMDLGRSYAELRRTQGLLIQLYILVLDDEIEELDKELGRLARLSKGKEKTETKLYLQLGYREIAVSKRKLLIGKNTRPYLYLMKLQELAFSLKSLKQAEKYVVMLGLLHDAEDEFDPEQRSFSGLINEVKRIIKKDQEKYLLYLYDSNFDSYGALDYYQQVWKQPDLFELATAIPDFDPSYIRLPEEALVPKI
ncbi:hypothetical protein P3G55_12390 [Leptospira sp. 96542]|nr:hypothetical protein [Leptospira sp. 96542]